MLVSIDRSGGVVIPKDVRAKLCLEPHTQLDLTITDDGLLLTPVRKPQRRIIEADGWAAIEAVPGLAISDADVVRRRDEGQR